MGFIREEVTNDIAETELTVVEREKHETREPWRFITIHMNSFDTLTPKELRQLGRWLHQQGIRLGREYKSNGTPKDPK